MKIFKTCFRFSKFQDKLNRAKVKAEIPIEGEKVQVQQENQNVQLNYDMNAIVRSTGTSHIFMHQPSEDTINFKEIQGTDFYKSRKNEKLRFKISGEESQVAIIDLYPGEKVRSESDKIIFMTEGVEMETHTAGGVGSAFKRFLGGSSIFVTDYSYVEETGYGRVAFAETFSSKIIPIRLDDYGGQINCKKGTYICGTPEVDINITFSKRFSTGFFGGEGFVLQQLSQQNTGQTVLLRAGGSLIKRSLRVGEKLKVSPGLVVAFDPNVHYDIEVISNFKSILGGARSLFQATFTGPGDIFLQTISFEHLIEEIASRVPSGKGGSSLFSLGGGGGDSNSDTGDVDDEQ